MSRSNYSEDLDNWVWIKWRGQVASATKGKRGQKLLIDLYAALESMPVKELVVGELQDGEGGVCALGALAMAQGLDLDTVDPVESDEVAKVFNIAPPLAREIVWMNDEYFHGDSPSELYDHMKRWVASQIREIK